jgi:hypothetical protein
VSAGSETPHELAVAFLTDYGNFEGDALEVANFGF